MLKEDCDRQERLGGRFHYQDAQQIRGLPSSIVGMMDFWSLAASQKWQKEMPPCGQWPGSLPLVVKMENIRNTPISVSITDHIRQIAVCICNSDFNGYVGSLL